MKFRNALLAVNSGYELVPLANGSFSVRSPADGETFHPVEGPIAEAEALYVEQLRLNERFAERAAVPKTKERPFVIWDIGLGAGGNVLTAIRRLSALKARLHVVSFDQTLDALRFACEHRTELRFAMGFETQIAELLAHQCCEFRHHELSIEWTTHIANCPRLLASETALPIPEAIFFDPFSPKRNPEMWTLTFFEHLFRRLDSKAACSLATFSRSTIARVTMLLAGFYVGAGKPIAGKEETTIAANCLELIERPLDIRWLDRVRLSQSAEPLHEAVYRQLPIAESSWARLRGHPQFHRRPMV